MAHAPECHGKIYGCQKCGRAGLTIDQTFDHECLPPTIPDGFRAVRFAAGPDDDAFAATFDGIVSKGEPVEGDPSRGFVLGRFGPYWNGWLMPYVTAETAFKLRDWFHRIYPTVREAHAEGVEWIDVVQNFDRYEFVIYNLQEEFNADDYYESGYPKDLDSWGTTNLLDVPEYAAQYPGSGWLDIGCIGIAWEEVEEQS